MIYYDCCISCVWWGRTFFNGWKEEEKKKPGRKRKEKKRPKPRMVLTQVVRIVRAVVALGTFLGKRSCWLARGETACLRVPAW